MTTLPTSHLPAALMGRSAYIVAATGMGKSHLLDAVTEHVVATGAGVVWRMQACGGLTADGADWDVHHDRTVEAKAILTAALGVVDSRARDAAVHGLRQHPGPPLYLLADDTATLDDDAIDQLAKVARLGRKTSVYVHATDQTPRRGRLRDECPARVLGACTDPIAAQLMFEAPAPLTPTGRGNFNVSLDRGHTVIHYSLVSWLVTALDPVTVAAAGEHYAGRSRLTTPEGPLS